MDNLHLYLLKNLTKYKQAIIYSPHGLSFVEFVPICII